MRVVGVMSENPLVTIGLPFSHEAVDQFHLAVASVLAQTYRNWELLLVADNATPELLMIAREVRDPRVRLLNDGMSRGLASRLNEVAQVARGDYLARMDSDDIMHPERIELSVKTFARHPSTSLVSTAALMIDEDSNLRGVFRSGKLSHDAIAQLRTSPIIHPSVMTRTHWSLQNPYDEKFHKAQDKELWIRALTVSEYEFISTPLLFYRVSSKISFAKHKITNGFDRKILLEYGPRQVGWIRTIALLARSWIKQAIFGAFILLRWERKIYLRKFDPIAPTELRSAKIALAAIQDVDIRMEGSI